MILNNYIKLFNMNLTLKERLDLQKAAKIITESQYKQRSIMITNELEIKQKLRKGSGTFKDMYFLDTHPDKVVKTFNPLDSWEEISIKNEIELQNKYPKLFTKIFKFNFKKGWFVQEKTNMDNFLIDVQKLKDDILQSAPNFKYIDLTPYLYGHIITENVDALESFKDLIKSNKNKQFYNKLVTYLKDLTQVKIKDVDGSTLDVHSENFGYNNKKEIKMFDI